MQQLNPSEISDIIKQRIEKLDVKAQAQNEDTKASSAIYFELLGHMSAIEGF